MQKDSIMIKAIFFDIDGTLVSFNTHRIPDSTKKALTLLREKGIKVFIATGRPFISIDNLEGLEFDAYITLNGGYCLTGNGEVIYKNSIPSADIQSLIECQKKTMSFPCMAATENEVTINFIDENVEHILKLINFSRPVIKDFETIKDKEIFQLMAFVNEDKEKSLMRDVLINCIPTRWNPLFTDIIKKGNSKQTGMDKLLEHYQIKLEETMAFGDGGNDIPMLKHAGTGIAMRNANDDVKQFADYITDSVDEDGIWNALTKFSVI